MDIVLRRKQSATASLREVVQPGHVPEWADHLPGVRRRAASRLPLPLTALVLAALCAALPGCAGSGSVVTSEPRRESEIVEPGTGMELVLVHGGRLEEYKTFDVGQGVTTPLPPAEISDYYMGRFEVTQAQWKSVMGANPSRVRHERRPVEQVSWDDATEFARRLSALSGRAFRLPTEAEWEWAFRRGRDSARPGVSLGADAGALAAYAGDSRRPIHDVGLRRADALGLLDLRGNVSEWCEDRYSSRPAEAGKQDGPDDGNRVLRGAAWDEPGGIEGAYRMGFHRSWVGRTVGFRVVSPAPR